MLWPVILISAGSIAALFTIAILLGRYLRPQPFERPVAPRPMNRAEFDIPIDDELSPLPFVDAIATPRLDDACPLCRKFMAATDEIYFDGERHMHSRCWMRGRGPEAA